MQLDDVALEPQPRSRHVETPDRRGAEPDLGDRLVPVLDENGAPVAEGPCVVWRQVLLVEDLQAAAGPETLLCSRRPRGESRRRGATQHLGCSRLTIRAHFNLRHLLLPALIGCSSTPVMPTSRQFLPCSFRAPRSWMCLVNRQAGSPVSGDSRPMFDSLGMKSRSRRCHNLWHVPRSNWMRRESTGAHFTLKTG